MNPALMNQNTLPFVDPPSGPLASAPVASAGNFGMLYRDDVSKITYMSKKYNTRAALLKEYAETSTGSAAPWSIVFRMPVASGNTRLRFKIKNGTASQITTTMYGAVSNIDSSAIPSVGSSVTGDPNTGWTQLKLDGSTSIVIPANAQVWTDWIDATLIDPLSGLGRAFVLHIPSMASLRYGNQTVNNNNTSDGWRTYSGATLTTNGTESTSICVCLGYEVDDGIVRKQSVAIGDSLTVGTNGPGWFGTAQNPLIGESNLGFAGKNTDYFLSTLQSIIASRPSIVFYSPHSPNDGTISDSIATAQKNKLMQAIRLCSQYDVQLISTMLCPNDNYNLSQDAFRVSVLDYARSSGSFVDMVPSVAQGTAPDRFIPSLKADVIHPNATGLIAMRALFSPFAANVYTNDFAWIPVGFP